MKPPAGWARRALLAGVFLLLFWLLLGRFALWRSEPRRLRIAATPSLLVADGNRIATIEIMRPGSAHGPAQISIVTNPHGLTMLDVRETSGGWQAQVRAGITPGRSVIRAEAPGFLPAQVELTTTLDATDSNADGTPDFLRLDSEPDQQAFRRWFSFLAEAQYFQKPAARPAELVDCAALIRYAYREALRLHEGTWARESRLPLVSGAESVSKYQYPYTPLGAALFRLRPGPFLAADLANGVFAQFADAQTLLRFNTHKIARNLSRALPGDLLFYRQRTGEMPYHSMIFLGRSQITRDNNTYVVYHTGPGDGGPGEIRMVSVQELVRHPDARWRPSEGNPVFLGIYRWNILRKAE